MGFYTDCRHNYRHKGIIKGAGPMDCSTNRLEALYGVWEMLNIMVRIYKEERTEVDENGKCKLYKL